MPILDLPMGSFAAVFRKTEEILKADATLARTIQTWITWDGTVPTVASSGYPLIRLEPTIGPMSWYSPDAQSGWLMAKVAVAIQSRYAEDYLNLWHAIEDALYPYGDWNEQARIKRSLTDAGAETGEWEFAMPAGEPNPLYAEEGIFSCVGMMRISVVRGFNP